MTAETTTVFLDAIDAALAWPRPEPWPGAGSGWR
jgi:hypothetical protein